MPGRGVAVEQPDVLGYEVGGRRHVDPLHRAAMRLGSERGQGYLGSNVPDDRLFRQGRPFTPRISTGIRMGVWMPRAI